jgi:hypothetical protein
VHNRSTNCFIVISFFQPAGIIVAAFDRGDVGYVCGFLAWSFGAGAHHIRKSIFTLGILIAAVLLIIMDLNWPQRGMISVGVGTAGAGAE